MIYGVPDRPPGCWVFSLLFKAMTDLDSCEHWLRQAWVELKAPLPRAPLHASVAQASPDTAQDLLNALCLGDLAAARQLCLAPPQAQAGIVHPQGMALALWHLLPVIHLIERDWQADRRSYSDTLYAYWNIQRLMQSLSQDGGQADHTLAPTPPMGRIFLASAPGCQHHLGVWVVADHFRTHGWQVQTLLDAPVHALIQAVRDERPDVVGLSVGHDAALQGVADLIRAIRHSNAIGPLRILLGGQVFMGSAAKRRGFAPLPKPHHTTFDWLGADAIATDAQDALAWCVHWKQPRHH